MDEIEKRRKEEEATLKGLLRGKRGIVRGDREGRIKGY